MPSETETMTNADETTAADSGQQASGEDFAAKYAEAQKRIKELNHENAERRKRLEALEKEKADSEAGKLSDLEKAQKELADLTPKYTSLQQQHQALLRERAFERAARELKLEFASEKAQETAYKLLDAETLGDDLSGMSEAVKVLQKEHAYLFAASKATPPETDATKKGKTTSGEMTDAEKQAIAARYRIPTY